MLSILNNPASLAAENQLNVTNAALESTLNQLSSGSRINTGADDAAGLAIANGLQANITALTQSARNANDGVGMLQVADGALAQVTTLLNRAVTLATESATGTVSNQQRIALDQEYQAIENEISRIGSSTNYNGTAVFGGSTNIFLSDGTNTGQTYNTIQTSINPLSPSALGLGMSASGIVTAIANPAATGTITITDPNAVGGAKTWTYTLVASLDTTTATNEVLVGSNLAQTLQNLADAINGNTATAGTAYAYNSGVAGSTVGAASSSVTASDVTPTSFKLTAAVPGTDGNAITFASSDANVALYTTNSTAGDLGGGSGAAGGLTSQTGAQAELQAIDTAIQTVAGQRGQIGAVINRLQSASNVISNQVQNLTSAENGIMAADIPTAVANLTKYSILEQTGISSLAQANQMQQLVLKLLQ